MSRNEQIAAGARGAASVAARAGRVAARLARALARESVVIAAALWRTLIAAARWARENLTWRRIKAIYRIASSALQRYWQDDGDAMAGYIAYSVFLSMFPFAIFATALLGSFLDPQTMDRAVKALFDLAPDHIARTLQPAVESVALQNPNALITTSALFAMWVASNAVEATRVAFDRAYRARAYQGFALRRLRSMAFVVLATLTFALLGALIVVAPIAIRYAELQIGYYTPYALTLLRYALALLVFAFFLFETNMFVPTRRPPRQRLWPGIYVSVTLFALGATGFSVYLSYAPSLSVTYGAFAGVIVTLLFFYLTGAAIIYGAEVNAVLMSFRRSRGSTYRSRVSEE